MANRLYNVVNRAGNGGRWIEARVYKDSSLGEFTVKLTVAGVHEKDADYFTDDVDDALGTAKMMADAAANRP